MVRKSISVEYPAYVDEALQLTLKSNGYASEKEFFQKLVKSSICGYINAANTEAWHTFKIAEYEKSQGGY